MKENNYHATLLDTDGNELSCTIRNPKLKLVREFRRKQRSLEVIRQEYSEIATADAENAAALVAAHAAGSDTTALVKEQEEIIKRKEDNDNSIYAALLDTADLVIIYPNKKDVTENPQRTKDDIDWEGSDLREIRGAVDFFADQSSQSSFASKN